MEPWSPPAVAFHWPDAPTFAKLSRHRRNRASEAVAVSTASAPLPAAPPMPARTRIGKENVDGDGGVPLPLVAPVPAPPPVFDMKRTTTRCGDAAAGASNVTALYEQFVAMRLRAEAAEQRAAALDAQLATATAALTALQREHAAAVRDSEAKDAAIAELTRAVAVKTKMARNST